MNQLLDRFFNYITFDTRANPHSSHKPSSGGQAQLAALLKNELQTLGLHDVAINEAGCVTGFLPPNVDKTVPTIAFVAHLDSSADIPGMCEQSQFIIDYQGKDIVLSGVGDEVLSPSMYPQLRKLIHHDLIIGDGKSTLGASNKASIAEIMTALSLIQSENIEHGGIQVVFLPDQTLHLSLKKCIPALCAERAYLFECSGIGMLSIENLNISRATLKIYGRNTCNHMMYDQIVNALSVAAKLESALAEHRTALSNGCYFDGFFHLTHLSGTVEFAEMAYLICNFSDDDFALQKQYFNEVVNDVKNGLPAGCHIYSVMKEMAQNRYSQLMAHQEFMRLTERAIGASQQDVYRASSRTTMITGAQLTEMGIPCISLSNGGYNHNSRHEFVVVKQMESAVELIKKLVQLTAEDAK